MNTRNLKIFILLFLTTYMASCKKADEETIIGKWQLVAMDNKTSYIDYYGTKLIINSDGTFEKTGFVSTGGVHRDINTTKGKWTNNNNQISFQLYGYATGTRQTSSGLDTIYSVPCAEQYILTSVKKNELILLNNNYKTIQCGCFQDSYVKTYTFKKQK